jgi:predicted transcriptional regulator
MCSEKTAKTPIEELFSSRGRIKVLIELAEASELNISEICKRVHLNHSTTKAHLQVLINSGLVEEKTFGRIKIYRYRIEDLRARSLRNFLDLWHA